MDKTIFYILLSTLFSIYIFIMIYSNLRLLKYIKNNIKISNANDIASLKNEVKIQMTCAIVALIIAIIMIITIFLKQLSFIEMVSINFLFGGTLVFSFYAKKTEKKISDIPTDTEELEEVKKHIVSVWHRKILPKFNK